MSEIPVTFKCQKQQIIGMLHIPEKHRKKYPAVLLLHGFTGNKQEAHRLFVDMSRALASAGIASLRFDFRGSGDSEGAFSDVTLAGEMEDAREALKFLRARDEVDSEKIGLLGMSMGGLVTSFVLGEEKNIAAAALWNPVGNPAYLVASRRSEKADQQLATVGVIDMEGWAVGKALVAELLTLRPLDAIVKTNAPVFILHAEKDESVPLSDMHEYVKVLSAAGVNVQSIILPNSNHTFDSLEWSTQAISHTLAWFRQMLK